MTQTGSGVRLFEWNRDHTSGGSSVGTRDVTFEMRRPDGTVLWRWHRPIADLPREIDCLHQFGQPMARGLDGVLGSVLRPDEQIIGEYEIWIVG